MKKSILLSAVIFGLATPTIFAFNPTRQAPNSEMQMTSVVPMKSHIAYVNTAAYGSLALGMKVSPNMASMPGVTCTANMFGGKSCYKLMSASALRQIDFNRDNLISATEMSKAGVHFIGVVPARMGNRAYEEKAYPPSKIGISSIDISGRPRVMMTNGTSARIYMHPLKSNVWGHRPVTVKRMQAM